LDVIANWWKGRLACLDLDFAPEVRQIISPRRELFGTGERRGVRPSCSTDRVTKNHVGLTLVCSAITKDEKWSQELVDATHIDRLNIGALKTIALNWLQPHEGNIIDFLFHNRAFQNSPPPPH
jgi:hypothetical protein